jgi:hypothetical protein
MPVPADLLLSALSAPLPDGGRDDGGERQGERPLTSEPAVIDEVPLTSEPPLTGEPTLTSEPPAEQEPQE